LSLLHSYAIKSKAFTIVLLIYYIFDFTTIR